MRWDIPQFPADLTLRKYHLARWISLIFFLIVSSLFLLNLLKEKQVNTNTFEAIRDFLFALNGLLLAIFGIFLAVIYIRNRDAVAHNEENLRRQQDWITWGHRSIPLIAFSTSLPTQFLKKITGTDSRINFIDKPIVTIENQPYESTEEVIRSLLFELSDVLINSIANQMISISIVSPSAEFTESDLHRLWLELELPKNQLGAVNLEQREMSTLFTEFYKEKNAQFLLVLMIDQYSSTQKIGAAWIIHNAQHLLDKHVPIIANLARLMTTDSVNLAKDIKNLNTFQKIEHPILSTFFSGLKQAEKIEVIECFYQTGYLAKNMSLMQVDMSNILGETLKLRDWFSFTMAIITMLSTQKEMLQLNISVKQRDNLLIGNVFR